MNWCESLEVAMFLFEFRARGVVLFLGLVKSTLFNMCFLKGSSGIEIKSAVAETTKVDGF